TDDPRVMTTLVVGDGAVARALAAALARAGEPPMRWWRARGGPIPAADRAILAVRDEALVEVATRVLAASPGAILVYCPGVVPPGSLAGPGAAGVGLLPPLVSLAGGAHDRLDGVAFAVQGDARGRTAALDVVARLGGVPLELPDGADALARYHAAA